MFSYVKFDARKSKNDHLPNFHLGLETISRAKWKIGGNGHFLTFWHKIQNKIDSHMSVSFP